MAVTLDQLVVAVRATDNANNRTALTFIQNAVTALVERYAPDAPDAVKDQAIIQACGYVWEAPASSPARMNFANAMQNSGAHAVLSPWRDHEAGVIGSSTS